MTLSSERRVVQNPLVRYAEEAGWTCLPPDEALRLRQGLDQPFLRDVLIAQLQRLNPGVVTSTEQATEVISRLLRIRPDIEGNRESWEYLKGLKTVFVQAERRECNLRLLDPQHVEVNTFHVTDEFRFHSGPNKIRADVVFLVNGIPVILVETKAATRLGGIAEAFDQIRRYHAEAPDLLVQTQLFALTHLVQFFYGATWSLSRKALFNWREEVGAKNLSPQPNSPQLDSPRPDFETLVKSFVAPRRVLRVLTDYILFARKDGELSKIVLRPHQMRAVERGLARAREAVRAQRAAPQRRRGLIWHTQGSGKTYTMLTLARLLLETPAFQNPTVLLIVDRNELQSQLFQNLEAVGFGRVQLVLSKRHLHDLLKADTRGLIVSMIHKFDDMPANLNTRANIFVLVDEAHRTTGGDLGNYLMGALPNATFIGFTGTPIDRTAHGQGTFKTFGADDPQGYLDKYSIRESIEDGTTVPLHYQLAPNDLIADREAMEAEIVQQHTDTSAIKDPQATYEIGTEALLALLHEDELDTVKVFNLLKELHRLVADEAARAPHLIPIGERAEEIRRRFEERLISAQEALQDLDEVVRQLQTAQEERRSSLLSPQAFAVEWWLRTQDVEAEKAAQTAASLEEAFALFPNWTISIADERELRTRLYKALLSLDVKEIVAWADRILDPLRRAAE